MQRLIFFTLAVSAYLFTACKKDSFIESGEALLSTSEEELLFDTVFTTAGSITQFFRIHNDNDQKLRLTKVELAGGSGSAFKINVDGSPGPIVNNLEIDANDSMYVFVSVHINPTATNLPFVIQDSISIQFNGNTRWIKLEAWGQNANFLRSVTLSANTVWNNTLPYVVIGQLQIDTNATLTIEEGTKVYLHADAPIIVDGTLRVNGKEYDSTRVHFTGDRLDEPYRDFPGSWPGIYFRGESKDNLINYAVIRNAYQGIIVEKPSINANPKLVMNQCILDNIYDAGILGVQSSIKANNCLISNAGKNVLLGYGGNYEFNHCTLASYSNSYILHKEPVLLVTNFIRDGSTFLTSDLVASFTNCIFWGDNGTVEDEVVVSRQGTAGIFNVSFTNSLWKVKTVPTGISSSGMIVNLDPLFDTIDISKKLYNFRLKAGSPAINKGVASPLLIDLDGNPRANGIPDLGSYEKQ